MSSSLAPQIQIVTLSVIEYFYRLFLDRYLAHIWILLTVYGRMTFFIQLFLFSQMERCKPISISFACDQMSSSSFVPVIQIVTSFIFDPRMELIVSKILSVVLCLKTYFVFFNLIPTDVASSFQLNTYFNDKCSNELFFSSDILCYGFRWNFHGIEILSLPHYALQMYRRLYTSLSSQELQIWGQKPPWGCFLEFYKPSVNP